MSTFQPESKKNRQGQKFSPEEIQQQFETERQNQQLLDDRRQGSEQKKKYFGLVKQFQETKNVNEREVFARELKEALDNPETPAGVKEFLQNRNKEVRFNEFMDLRKVTSELREVGEISQKMVNPKSEFNPKRTMSELIQDDTIDPKVKNLARQFQEYLPKYNLFQQKQDPGFTKGETISTEETKVIIRDSQGKQILKPGESDDPRLVGTMARNFEQLLEPNGFDSFAESQGKPATRDDVRGVGYISTMQNPNTSPIMKEIGGYLEEKGRAFEPERTKEYVPELNTRLNKPVEKTGPDKDEKKSKWTMPSFGKKKTGISQDM